MTPRLPSKVEDEAVAWFVALRGSDVVEADFLAFRDWLEASPDHGEAYGRVEQVWTILDAPAAGSAARPARVRRPLFGRAAAVWATAGLAAAVAVVFIAPQLTGGPSESYQTAKGERRDIALADGSHLVLNSGSSARVRLAANHRTVNLESGEALFDVVHDPARPFEVRAGKTVIRDIGTTFNVRRQNEGLTLTVLRGSVAVSGGGLGSRSLTEGDQIQVAGGAAVQSKLEDPDAVSAWRVGRLVYRDQSLSDIVADLNRYLPIPVSVDASAGSLRFSGVLQLDREDVMLRRLEGLLPVRATSTPQGARLTSRS